MGVPMKSGTAAARPLKAAWLVCLFSLLSSPSCLAEAKITFIDVGQGDSAVIQIAQPVGEPFTIIVDGGDGDDDLKDNLHTKKASDQII
jgi:beta-lactamase superfamily II metal-dependent hydrolase